MTEAIERIIQDIRNLPKSTNIDDLKKINVASIKKAKELSKIPKE